MTVDQHSDDPTPDGIRSGVREFLAEKWVPGQLSDPDWLDVVVRNRWAVPRWPTDSYGRGLPDSLASIVEEEFDRVGAPGSGQDRFNMHANTVRVFGSDELRASFVRPMLTSEFRMCLLYSEPGAGSDLASLRTRAVREGDEWVIDGQKVWTSGAADADYAFLLARTDWNAPKHKGISFFLFPMKQDGIEVRPIKQITGESEFNEVFITGARVSDGLRLGELHGGWKVLQRALVFERLVMGDRARAGRDNDAMAVTQYSGEEDLIGLARTFERLEDPVIRDRLATVMAMRTVNKWNSQRAEAEAAAGVESAVAALGKLSMSGILHESAALRSAIVGAECMADGRDHPDGDTANFLSMNAFMTSIGGGTDQVQRNIIGERVLGLPREEDPTRQLPFSKASMSR
ncbi:acyl-CoA dehydrogenase family protein [Rhodococcus ruber]|uniref:Acyl-CoA dehydrogenase family protein n=1 Tax=Rhodococcus ruber TaxID=1830 RepID=A0ABT4MEQ8_9NOCA|nr:acyl-CoA dehydrogenase family protein [Rhodococcus ruber]MCZ4519478.1 acyl-CoA dehydrogenase family protein [Rhodococcus ruber]